MVGGSFHEVLAEVDDVRFPLEVVLMSDDRHIRVFVEDPEFEIHC